MDFTDALDRVWSEDTKTIRNFLTKRPAYKKLAEEIAYILEMGYRKRASSLTL
ncbi:MAG: hypothetical protein HN356_15390 [Calditrichaeota bacterium]|jgi:hypothetical protein|nr:hypothetical protein [Calditrichota bacterium]MBT7788319.1 hypothetical protein [Calditrichota bacterium]